MLQNIIAFIAIAGIAAAIGYFARKYVAQSQVNSAEGQAQKIITEAKAKEQEVLLKAREKALQFIDESKKEQDGIRRELKEQQQLSLIHI